MFCNQLKGVIRYCFCSFVSGTYIETSETVRYICKISKLLINRQSSHSSTMNAFVATFNLEGDNGETEDGQYTHADLEDVMEQGEIGEQFEDMEKAIGAHNADEDNFDQQMRDLHRACVSEKSQQSYIGSMVLMLNWLVRKSFDDLYTGFQPVTDTIVPNVLAFPNLVVLLRTILT